MGNKLDFCCSKREKLNLLTFQQKQQIKTVFDSLCEKEQVEYLSEDLFQCYFDNIPDLGKDLIEFSKGMVPQVGRINLEKFEFLIQLFYLKSGSIQEWNFFNEKNCLQNLIHIHLYRKFEGKNWQNLEIGQILCLDDVRQFFQILVKLSRIQIEEEEVDDFCEILYKIFESQFLFQRNWEKFYHFLDKNFPSIQENIRKYFISKFFFDEQIENNLLSYQSGNLLTFENIQLLTFAFSSLICQNQIDLVYQFSAQSNEKDFLPQQINLEEMSSSLIQCIEGSIILLNLEIKQKNQNFNKTIVIITQHAWDKTGEIKRANKSVCLEISPNYHILEQEKNFQTFKIQSQPSLQGFFGFGLLQKHEYSIQIKFDSNKNIEIKLNGENEIDKINYNLKQIEIWKMVPQHVFVNQQIKNKFSNYNSSLENSQQKRQVDSLQSLQQSLKLLNESNQLNSNRENSIQSGSKNQLQNEQNHFQQYPQQYQDLKQTAFSFSQAKQTQIKNFKYSNLQQNLNQKNGKNEQLINSKDNFNQNENSPEINNNRNSFSKLKMKKLNYENEKNNSFIPEIQKTEINNNFSKNNPKITNNLDDKIQEILERNSSLLQKNTPNSNNINNFQENQKYNYLLNQQNKNIDNMFNQLEIETTISQDAIVSTHSQKSQKNAKITQFN